MFDQRSDITAAYHGAAPTNFGAWAPSSCCSALLLADLRRRFAVHRIAQRPHPSARQIHELIHGSRGLLDINMTASRNVS
jgi:hypothetical protein